MSNAARKERKRNGIKFEHKVKEATPRPMIDGKEDTSKVAGYPAGRKERRAFLRSSKNSYYNNVKQSEQQQDEKTYETLDNYFKEEVVAEPQKIADSVTYVDTERGLFKVD